MTVPSHTSKKAGIVTAEMEAIELLSEKGYPNSTVVLLRSAGDTNSCKEEIWFFDQFGHRIVATLTPEERKQLNGQQIKWTKLDIEYGW